MEAILNFFLDSDHLILRIIGWIIMILILLLALGAILIVLALGIFVIWAICTTKTSGDFTYHHSDGMARLSAYKGSETAIVLPATLDDMPVISFSLMSDESGLVEDVTIPDELTTVNDVMFTITFPSLQNYHVSDTHPTLMVIDGALYSKDGKTLISYPQGRTGVAVIPEGVESIASGAFLGSAASDVILPQSLRTIAQQSMCNFRVLRTLEIPAGVTSIHEDAFKSTAKDAAKPQLIVTEGSFAHAWALEREAPIREVLPAPESPADEAAEVPAT